MTSAVPQRFSLLAFGSRGDVQPFLALGLALQARGHAVTLYAPDDFAAQSAAHALPFVPLGMSVEQFLQGRAGQVMMTSGSNLFKLFAALPEAGKALRGALDGVGARVLDAFAASDTLVIHALLAAWAQGALDLYAARGLPAPRVWLSAAVPLFVTGAFPSPFFPELPLLGGAYNRWSIRLTLGLIFAAQLSSVVNPWRRRLGLPPTAVPGILRRLSASDALLSYSPHVLPRPQDWGAHAHVCGSWLLPPPDGWTPPPALHDFLARGAPPVFVGFGSMNTRDPQAVAQRVVAALRQAGQRGVLQMGWGGMRLGHEHDDMLALDYAPHDWLFPRMAGVVHHGGSGTTSAALRAGVPSLVVPFLGDQPMWGRRVAALGAGPAPLPIARLSVERLARAVRQLVTDDALRARAAHLGALLRAEDGIGAAMNLLEAQSAGG